MGSKYGKNKKKTTLQKTKINSKRKKERQKKKTIKRKKDKNIINLKKQTKQTKKQKQINKKFIKRFSKWQKNYKYGQQCLLIKKCSLMYMTIYKLGFLTLNVLLV